MHGPRPAFTLALTCLALLATGCGGSGGGPNHAAAPKSSVPAVTPAQFAARANALCLRARRRTVTAAKAPANLVDYAARVDMLLRSSVRLRRDLAALRRPPAQSVRVRYYLSTYDAPLLMLRRLRTAAEDGDGKAVRRLASRFPAVRAPADKTARLLGLRSCAAPAVTARRG